jgi:hypothetical protein
MEVADNLGFKLVLNLVKNTFMMITKIVIQMTLGKIAQICIIKIQIMNNI